MSELQNHYEIKDDFQFSKDGGSDPALQIILPLSFPSGWIVGQQGKTKVYIL